MGRKFGPMSEEHKRRISDSNTGRRFKPEHRLKLSTAAKNRPRRVLSEETKRKIGEANKIALKGHIPWNKGTRKCDGSLRSLRLSHEYQLWRRSVYERDRWTCVFCGYRSRKKGDIHADHIKPFALFPELRFAIDNGRTLCVPCHKKTPTYGSRTH